jgi:hypothetical protein
LESRAPFCALHSLLCSGSLSIAIVVETLTNAVSVTNTKEVEDHYPRQKFSNALKSYKKEFRPFFQIWQPC